MKWIVFLALLVSSSASARVVWQDGDFCFTTVGIMKAEIFADWVGIKLVVDIPDNGYVALRQRGSIDLHFPCKGWVRDLGILVLQNCSELRDSLNFRTMVITANHRCDRTWGKVPITVRVPKMLIPRDCRPDSMRWVGGYYDTEN